MIQKLNLGERFSLLGILPQEGNFATLKVVRKLRESLSLNENELKEYEVKIEGDQIRWSPAKSLQTKDVEISDFAEEMIKSKLKKLNDDGKLEDKHFSLYEKFFN